MRATAATLMVLYVHAKDEGMRRLQKPVHISVIDSISNLHRDVIGCFDSLACVRRCVTFILIKRNVSRSSFEPVTREMIYCQHGYEVKWVGKMFRVL